jgi:uncharacterized membrane protein
VPVSYDDAISHVVDVVEGVGAGIMVLGAVGAAVLYARQVRRGTERAYQQLRENLGRVILLGLEVLIIADIVRTIVVEPSLESVAVLGIIVVIRILLSFSLEVEIDGVWPWQRARLEAAGGADSRGVPSPSPDRADPVPR